MLILQSHANKGARTVSGLWKFKNKEGHDDGITFNELCALGSKIAIGHLGFPGNLFSIYAGLADGEEMAFLFGYQPGPSESTISAEDLQRQFVDFFTQHTAAFLGWEITSDKTPEVEVQVAPLPRNNGFWNNLPKAVYSNDKAVDGNTILSAWGMTGLSGELPSDYGDYIGWQRVALPPGWTIGLEGNGFLLIDGFNQVRGEIQGAFERNFGKPITLNLTDNDIYGDIPKKEIAKLKKARREYQETKPRLVLKTSISFQSSSSMASYGPYDYWVENAAGERLFGIYRQPVTDDEYDKRIPKLRQRIFDWMEVNYPNWKDHNAYWDIFPQEHVKWNEAEQMSYSVATKILKDKTDENMQALRTEIGIGEPRTDYTLALQKRLSEHFGEEPPYRIAHIIVQKMLDIFDMRIGRINN